MGRPPLGSSAAAVRTVGAAGAVAAAVGAHVGAGAALPSPVLLAAAVAGVAGLAALVGRLPARLRTVRLQLAAVAALQPALHALFDLRAPSEHIAAMALAHLAAVLVSVWWLNRGAARLVAVAGTAARRLAGSCPSVVRIPAVRPRPAWASSVPIVDGRDPLVGLRRRGPPVGTVHV